MRCHPLSTLTRASLVINPDPGRGQFSSLQVGLHEVLNRGRDGRNDHACRSSAGTLRNHRDSGVGIRNWLPLTGKWAAVPEYQGKHGHPILIGREMLEAFLRAPENIKCPRSGARASKLHRICFGRRSVGRHECRYSGAVFFPSLTAFAGDIIFRLRIKLFS